MLLAMMFGLNAGVRGNIKLHCSLLLLVVTFLVIMVQPLGEVQYNFRYLSDQLAGLFIHYFDIHIESSICYIC